MAETNNLKLALPTSNEYVDVEVLNENFRKIDTSILLALAAAAPYSAAATYAQGAYCTKDGKLYRCTVAILQAEAWNAAHWTATTVGAELVAIYTTLANKAPGVHAGQHAKGGSDPITPESIGAAPGGHGLGDAAIPEAPNRDANKITTTGWYMAAVNVPKDGWWLISSITYGDTRYQFAYANEGATSALNGTVLQRSKKGALADWTPWEYINPPMKMDVEYRTTERCWGLPVYYKIVDCGKIADNKEVAHGIENMHVCISAQGMRGDSVMPTIYNHNLSDPWSCYVITVNRTVIKLACGTSAAGGNCNVILKYTKTTD